MLNSPHGGVLKDLLARDFPRQKALLNESNSLQWISLNDRQTCDLELILNGAFSPLEGYMTEQDYEGVVENMRLPNHADAIFPIPIYLDLPRSQALLITQNSRIVLASSQKLPLAILTVTSIFAPEKSREALKVFGWDDTNHPAVKYLYEETGDVYLGGPIDAIQPPKYWEWEDIRYTPASLRAHLKALWDGQPIVAFQTRNPMHRAHLELTKRAAERVGAKLLLHPVVGPTQKTDLPAAIRVRVYKALLPRYPSDGDGSPTAVLSLLPLGMRMGGPREALWHAIIRKNYGATHFIVGRDHAGPSTRPSSDKTATFYDPYAAQALLLAHQSELGIQMVPFRMVTYCPDRRDVANADGEGGVTELGEYVEIDRVKDGERTWNVSGTELRNLLRTNQPLPTWFTFPEVATILKDGHPIATTKGFLLFLSDPSQTMSVFAAALKKRLEALAGRRVVDVFDETEYPTRALLVKSLGGFVRAAGVGIVLSPSRDVSDVRRVIEQNGNSFVHIVIQVENAGCNGACKCEYAVNDKQSEADLEVSVGAELGGHRQQLETFVGRVEGTLRGLAVVG